MQESTSKIARPIVDEETHWRTELAAGYRLFVKFGWTDLIFTHLSARDPGASDQYFINPYGLMFNEITASNLLKVDFSGDVLSGGHPLNEAGHAIHSSVLQARPDVNVVLHSHTRAGIAVSCMREGLLPLSQHAGEVRDLICYHDYGIAEIANPEECRRLGQDIGDKWLMIMRNHGLLALGRTMSEAFYHLYMLELACKIQVDVMSCTREFIFPPTTAANELAEYTIPSGSQPIEEARLSWQALLRWLDINEPDYKS